MPSCTQPRGVSVPVQMTDVVVQAGSAALAVATASPRVSNIVARNGMALEVELRLEREA